MSQQRYIDCPAGSQCLGSGRHLATNTQQVAQCMSHSKGSASHARSVATTGFSQDSGHMSERVVAATENMESFDDFCDAADKINEMIDSNNGQPIKMSFPHGTVSVMGAQAVEGHGAMGNSHLLYEVDPVASAGFFRAGQQDCFYSSPEGKQVTVDKTGDIKSCRAAYISHDGCAGAYLKKSGEFGGLFSVSGSRRGVATALLDNAVETHGDEMTHLECFNTYLPKIYDKSGFVAIGKIPFDPKHAPKGWDYDYMSKYNEGHPDILIMVHEDKLSDNQRSSRVGNDTNPSMKYSTDHVVETSYDDGAIDSLIDSVKK